MHLADNFRLARDSPETSHAMRLYEHAIQSARENGNARNRYTNSLKISDTAEVQSRGVISRDETCLLLAERKYGGSKLDWLLQKDQVARIEFNGLRVRNQILRVSCGHDLIVLCSNQQRCRGLDARGVLPNIHTKVNPDDLLDRAPVRRCESFQ
jgi:hypothetical protein